MDFTDLSNNREEDILAECASKNSENGVCINISSCSYCYLCSLSKNHEEKSEKEKK